MAAQFCLRNKTPYIATTGYSITCVSTGNKFIIYDGIDKKHYAYDPKDNTKYTYFDDNGDVTSYGHVKDAFYSISQSGNELNLQ